MQILKIEKIKNVGQIKEYTARGDVAFKKFNAIYGENAVGKSTLAMIFRALKTGDATAVGLKKTLGVAESAEQEVQVKVKDGEQERVFLYKKPNTWQTHKIPEIEIFDAYFVEKNILSGWQCSTEHQKNLPTLILGEEGIKQAIELEKYKKELNETIPVEENRIKGEIIRKNSDFLKVPFSGARADEFLKKFYNMPKPVDGYDYDKHIEETTSRIKILEALVNNPERQPFKKLAIPEFDKDYFVNKILHKTLEALSKDAETKVKEHARAFGMPNALWLVQGHQFLGEKDKCPFCGQSILNIDLVSCYKSYFSEEYRNFANSLRSYNGLDVFEENGVTELVNSILMNAEIRRAFNGGITDKWPEISIDELKVVYADLNRILKNAYDKKKTAVLDLVDLPDDFDAVFSRFTAFVNQFNVYNKAIDDTNAKLSGLNPDDLESERKRLLVLNLQKTRHCILNELAETEVKTLIDRRHSTDMNYRTLQESFRTNAIKFKDDYEFLINGFLEKFGVNFRIHITPPNLRTSKPSYDFGIIIDNCNEHIVAARPKTSIDEELCIGNALSEGDKSTLVLAFFLAKLKRADSLSNKIVVVDDPISSLGISRKRRTIVEIQDLSKQVSQLFVLSHDALFLDTLFRKIPNAEKKSLKLAKIEGVSSVIEECNLSEIVKDRHLKAYDSIKQYSQKASHTDADKRQVVADIRIYLEGLLQSLYPAEFKHEKYLGDYCSIINSNPNHKLRDIKDKLEYLKDLSSPEHHSSSEGAPTDAETAHAVSETLGLVDFLLEPPKVNNSDPITAKTVLDTPLKM